MEGPGRGHEPQREAREGRSATCRHNRGDMGRPGWGHGPHREAQEEKTATLRGQGGGMGHKSSTGRRYWPVREDREGT